MADKKNRNTMENGAEQKKNGQESVSFWKKIAAAGLVAGLAAGFILGSVTGVRIDEARTQRAKEKQAEKERSGKYYQIAKKVTLGKYKGLEISLAPTEEDLQSEIDSVLQEYTNYEQKKGTAQDGDMVYAEFEGSINGVKMDELCGKDYVNIGAREWLEDFESAFIGMKTGKTKKADVKIPQGTYGNEHIDGKTVRFKLTLKYICGEAIIPEYNDEFVQSVSEYQSVEEYNEHIEEELLKTAREQKAEYAWSEVVQDCEIKEYPEDMIAAAKEEVLQGYYDMADMQGFSHDEIFQSFGCADEQDFVDTQLDELAKDTVKEIMVAQAIANKEGIAYTKKEYRTLLKDEYENNKSSYDSEEDFEKSNEEYLKNSALIDKVKSWIEKKTKYKEEKD